MATRELHSSPNMLALYARAVAPMIPGVSRLPFVGGGGGEMPELELTLRGVTVEPERLAAYAKVCGFAPGETLPATYPHMLSFPLHMAVMADGRFPFGPIGLVHISNRIVQHRPLSPHESMDLRVNVTPLEDHPRGRSFTLISQARVGGELVWEESSTMLRRGHARAAGGAQQSKDRLDAPPKLEEWSLPGEVGRRYAAVSGDRNPIHMHPLTAKPFGFSSAIAHGMWTKARCLAALGSLPDAFAVEVRFRAPIPLPAKVAFASVHEGSAIRFAVSDVARGTPHLEGRLEPVPGEAQTSERSDTP
jgi:acyl dehydratase